LTGSPEAPGTAPARICPGPAEAAGRLADGELVAFPTETVWGLAAAARNEEAVARLFRWKDRAAGTAVAVLVEDRADAEALGAEFPETAAGLAATHWPGPLTLVLRCPGALASGVAGADGTVGFRCSSHPAATALARAATAAGIGPLTATSLNRSGEPPARTRAEALALCARPLCSHVESAAGRPWVLAAGADAGGADASTVVRAVAADVTVLREGGIRP